MAKSKLPYDRLTFDGNFCDIAMCYQQRWGKYCPDGACSQRKVWERLKEYEDTTLSPSDVREYKKFEDNLIASGMTLNDLLTRASAGIHFTSVKDCLPSKDSLCLCVRKPKDVCGNVFQMLFYYANSFVNELEEDACAGFYEDCVDVAVHIDDVVLWAELPDNITELVAIAENTPPGCAGCKWDGKRHQKCSCCRRNLNMKDNWEAEP